MIMTIDLTLACQHFHINSIQLELLALILQQEKKIASEHVFFLRATFNCGYFFFMFFDWVLIPLVGWTTVIICLWGKSVIKVRDYIHKYRKVAYFSHILVN